MQNINYLAPANIIDFMSGCAKEQVRKQSSLGVYQQLVDDLSLVFVIIYFMREQLQAIYDSMHPKSPNNIRNAGRKAVDICFMFKLLVLQVVLDCSVEHLLFIVSDSMSIRKALNIQDEDDIPKPSTVAAYRKMFAQVDISPVIDSINFGLQTVLESYLKENNYSYDEFMQVNAIDSTFVDARIRRDPLELNQLIKQGTMPPEKLYPNPHVRSQKDLDAKFSKKYNITHFGYKVHVMIDCLTRFIVNVVVTPANTHDSQVVEELVGELANKPKNVFADSAYNSKSLFKQFKEWGSSLYACTPKRRGKPLSEEDKLRNRCNSRIRRNVEHCFSGHIDRKRLHTYGIKQATLSIKIMYLFENVKRVRQILQGRCLLKNAKQKLQDALYAYTSKGQKLNADNTHKALIA